MFRPATVQTYINNHQQDLQRTRSHYQSLNFNQALTQALTAQVPSGSGTVMDSHQCNIGYTRMQALSPWIQNNSTAIQNAMNWHQLFSIFDSYRLSPAGGGLGQLWSYDYSLRMAFQMYPNKGAAILPSEVYLQRGTRRGVRALLNINRVYGPFISVNRLPSLLVQQLQPYEIENYLCIGHRLGWF